MNNWICLQNLHFPPENQTAFIAYCTDAKTEARGPQEPQTRIGSWPHAVGTAPPEPRGDSKLGSVSDCSGCCMPLCLSLPTLLTSQRPDFPRPSCWVSTPESALERQSHRSHEQPRGGGGARRPRPRDCGNCSSGPASYSRRPRPWNYAPVVPRGARRRRGWRAGC